jgi:hypothetical protein
MRTQLVRGQTVRLRASLTFLLAPFTDPGITDINHTYGYVCSQTTTPFFGPRPYVGPPPEPSLFLIEL